MEFEYNKQLPAADEYNQLRENVGWGVMPVNVIEKSLAKTVYGVSVYRENKIIGSGRIVGDGGLCFYIQDIMVLKDFQKRGVGSKIVKMLMDYLEENAPINSYTTLDFEGTVNIIIKNSWQNNVIKYNMDKGEQ